MSGQRDESPQHEVDLTEFALREADRMTIEASHMRQLGFRALAAALQEGLERHEHRSRGGGALLCFGPR